MRVPVSGVRVHATRIAQVDMCGASAPARGFDFDLQTEKYNDWIEN